MKRILISLVLASGFAVLAFLMNSTVKQEHSKNGQKTPTHQSLDSESSSVKESADTMINNVETFQRLLETFHGQVVYLDFWASWCIPCRESFPWMNEMQLKYQDSGLKIITVNLDAERENAEDFLAQYPAEFDVLFDPKGQVARYYDLPGMPSSMVFNREGKLIERHVGFNKEKQQAYQLQLENLLKE